MRAAAQAIEDISLTLLMLWLILRIVVLGACVGGGAGELGSWGDVRLGMAAADVTAPTLSCLLLQPRPTYPAVMPCMAYMGARPGRPAWPQAAVPVSAEMQAAPTTPAAAVATDLEAGRGGGRPAAAPAAAAEGVPALVWPAAP